MATQQKKQFKYPGSRMAIDGNTAVILCEREASDAAGAYPITPSTQMGEYWAEQASAGHINVSGKPLIFVEPESEHAAAAVTAGMSMSGLRATNFSSAQGIAFMHESLYAAVGKRLPYVLNVGARAITKASLNVHCGHDDYHCIDDTGFFQMFAANAQQAADLNLIGRKIAELSLTPAAVAQDGFLTTHLIEPVMVPERELIEEFCGKPDDIIECPTPAQKMIYGEKRRRVPELWDVDNPVVAGSVQNQDAYMQSVAAQRPYFFEHISNITDECMEEYYQLTGRRYQRIIEYAMSDAEYVILAQGSLVEQACAVADYLRSSRQLKVGVINLTMYRPFPGDLISRALKGRKGVAVLERTDQPLAEDLPIIREVRAALTKCQENGLARGEKPYPSYDSYEFRDMPRLYSGCYGLGSRDLQPEGVIAAIENMLPKGEQKTFFYLGIDFYREESQNPKEEIRQQALLDAYPDIRSLSLKGSENPDLLPEGAITARLHSIGGWGMITTGKNLAVTLYDLLGYDIRANPKYGSEKKGQPTTYYLSAAPEPIRLNCEYHYVDVVMSPDAKVFNHSNPLFGLKPEGVFIIQSALKSPEEVWATIPLQHQQYIVDNNIRIFYLDGFKIAREEASNPELQYRMQGNAFQGAFFKASPLLSRGELTEEGLFKAIHSQLEHKFGHKGAHVVEDNIRVVRRGFDELVEITEKTVGASLPEVRSEEKLPVMLKQVPVSSNPQADLHKFWDQTAAFYAKGQGDSNPADPDMALSLMPAGTGAYRDMTNIRFEYPQWLPENCTACGDCFTICPDSALPALVNTFGEVFETAINRIETSGTPTRFLRRDCRNLEKRIRELVDTQGEQAGVSRLIDQAVLEHLSQSELEGSQKAAQELEFTLLLDQLGQFDFAITKPYYTSREKKAKGSGGLLSITVNPNTCKGCMECIQVCSDNALVAKPQTDEVVDTLRKNWDFWMDLPTTSHQFSRIDDLDEKVGALETLLMDKGNYLSTVCGDGACLGCGEKSIIHLFTGTVTALMQPRVKRHLEEIDSLIKQLETHIRMKLAGGVDITNVDAIEQAIDAHRNDDLTLANLTESLSTSGASTPIDPKWLRWVTQLMEKLKHLKWCYTEGTTGRGRAAMGITNATGCTSVWGATYPYHPYPFPWANHLFQDSTSLAMGIFEGHMAKMAEGFKAIRQVKLELGGQYEPETHDSFFTYFDWKQFSDDEYRLCPPVVAIGGDGAMYDIGFQNLSRAMASGTPLKVLVLDTQVYSNTGGQACTSSFVSQVADMSPYGKAKHGKTEMRKEISLIGMAHRTSFVLQSSTAHTTHLLEGFIDGLNSRHPALFNLYAACPVEHGIGDDMARHQSRLAVDSRAYPLFRYDPDAGSSYQDCASIEGNTRIQEDWVSYPVKYLDEDGNQQTLQLPLTFADFALTEGRFSKHFRRVPAENWNDQMVPLHEFLDMDNSDREGLYPYIMATDKDNHLTRVLVAAEMVNSCDERRHFWRQLRSLTGIDHQAVTREAADQARVELASSLTARIQELMGGVEVAPSIIATEADNRIPAMEVGGSEGVWLESPECTACDECINIAPGVFAYGEDGKAYIKDPRGASFKDIVKAAEKCTAGSIHPGVPWDQGEKDLDKLIKRAEKYQ